MKTPQFIIFLLLCLSPVISFSQPINYSLKQNIVQWSECDNPQNGFILTGKTVTRTANNDSFILNTNKEVFSWNDNKGQSENKIYHFQSKNSDLNIQYVFLTEHNAIRITTNKYKEAIIEIVCQINSKWYCLSYLCQETTSPQTIINENRVTDIDGNVYKTVRIGSQIWMAENLKTTRYNDGAAISLVSDNSNSLPLSTGAYCVYNIDASDKSTNEALYNWYSVNTNKLCPIGWHVPTNEEWTTLTDYLGGESVAGGKMKEIGTAHWSSPNTEAVNSSGFSGLPTGSRYTSKVVGIGEYGVWWSSTEVNTINARSRCLKCNYKSVYRGYGDKQSCSSIRCLKDN